MANDTGGPPRTDKTDGPRPQHYDERVSPVSVGTGGYGYKNVTDGSFPTQQTAIKRAGLTPGRSSINPPRTKV